MRDLDRYAVFALQVFEHCPDTFLIACNNCGSTMGHNHFRDPFFFTPSKLGLYGGMADQLAAAPLVAQQRASDSQKQTTFRNFVAYLLRIICRGQNPPSNIPIGLIAMA